LYYSDKEIVVPGQLLSDDGRRSGFGTYSLNGKVYAALAGLVRMREGVITVVPVKGPYQPEPGDSVVAIVTDVKPNVAEASLGGYATATLRFMERQSPPLGMKIGDVIYAKVKSSGLRGVFLSAEEDLKKISSGFMISMSPAKVPRLIGRKGSMISMLKKETGCSFWIGRNGLIVVSGPSPAKEFAAISAVRLVDREAHSQGLTDRVGVLLKKALEGNKDGDAGQTQAP